MKNLYFKVVILESCLTLKTTIFQAKKLHDPFIKQAKYKLKGSHSKDFFEFTWCL